MKKSPESCDTFVIFPPLTRNGLIIFGKNSDRPNGEVQEVVYHSAKLSALGTKCKCTYIEIEEVQHKYGVILSKPSWMWGAEMGANEHGVCIGNEAVWTNVEIDPNERLLGMDMVRLGLERSKTAKEALDVLIYLLETYGQGGPCSDSIPNFTYHNSFLIADRSEAWIFETAGELWAAERVTSGYRHISNCLSIETKIDRKCSNLEERAKSLGLWNGKGEFNFKKVMEDGDSDTDRIRCGRKLLDKLTCEGLFDVPCMFEILRDSDSGICRGLDHDKPTAGSMVSVLEPFSSAKVPCHWFTGTPDPSISIFKPFVFTPLSTVPASITSPQVDDALDPAKNKPRFSKKIDRAHPLHKLHSQVFNRPSKKVATVKEQQKTLEMKFLDTLSGNSLSDEWLNGVPTLFSKGIGEEMEIYERFLK